MFCAYEKIQMENKSQLHFYFTAFFRHCSNVTKGAYTSGTEIPIPFSFQVLKSQTQQ